MSTYTPSRFGELIVGSDLYAAPRKLWGFLHSLSFPVLEPTQVIVKNVEGPERRLISLRDFVAALASPSSFSPALRSILSHEDCLLRLPGNLERPNDYYEQILWEAAQPVQLSFVESIVLCARECTVSEGMGELRSIFAQKPSYFLFRRIIAVILGCEMREGLAAQVMIDYASECLDSWPKALRFLRDAPNSRVLELVRTMQPYSLSTQLEGLSGPYISKIEDWIIHPGMDNLSTYAAKLQDELLVNPAFNPIHLHVNIPQAPGAKIPARHWPRLKSVTFSPATSIA